MFCRFGREEWGWGWGGASARKANTSSLDVYTLKCTTTGVSAAADDAEDAGTRHGMFPAFVGTLGGEEETRWRKTSLVCVVFVELRSRKRKNERLIIVDSLIPAGSVVIILFLTVAAAAAVNHLIYSLFTAASSLFRGEKFNVGRGKKKGGNGG